MVEVGSSISGAGLYHTKREGDDIILTIFALRTYLFPKNGLTHTEDGMESPLFPSHFLSNTPQRPPDLYQNKGGSSRCNTSLSWSSYVVSRENLEYLQNQSETTLAV